MNYLVLFECYLIQIEILLPLYMVRLYVHHQLLYIVYSMLPAIHQNLILYKVYHMYHYQAIYHLHKTLYYFH